MHFLIESAIDLTIRAGEGGVADLNTFAARRVDTGLAVDVKSVVVGKAKIIDGGGSNPVRHPCSITPP